MSKKSLKSRRLATATLGVGLVVALTSCSGATNKYGNIPSKVYASSGEYKLTYKELWNELQWQADDVIEEQVTNVVLQSYVNNITAVDNATKVSDLTDKVIKSLGIDTKLADGGEKQFQEIKEWYENNLIDYVILDIYNFNYNDEGYDENMESVGKTSMHKLEIKYVDEIYQTYHVDKVTYNGTEYQLSDLVVGVYDADKKEYKDGHSKSDYLKIARSDELKSVYYKIFAQKLLAYDKHREDVFDDDEEDSDYDDTVLGHYNYSSYATKFKTQYVNQNDLELILLNFSSSSEFEDTLMAFGLKFYNGKLYYIKDKTNNMTFTEYTTYYENVVSNTDQLNTQYGAICVDNTSYAAILEIYVQLYNYIYSGYRNPIQTKNINYGVSEGMKGDLDEKYSLDNLRFLTQDIIADYSAGNDKELRDNAISNIEDALKDATSEDDTRIVYTSDELQDLNTTVFNQAYNTLDADKMSKCYSTSTVSGSNGNYLIYKLKELENMKDGEEIDEKTLAYSKWYDEVYDREGEVSNYEIVTYILENDDNLDELGGYSYGSLKYTLEDLLIKEDLASESTINSYVTDEGNDCSIKIYNEAAEISYAAAHSSYSKVVKKNSNKNVLATIKYDGTKYNLYIYADENTKTKKAVCKLGSDEALGVFNYLENKSGASTAVTLLTNKMIKKTQAYKDTKKDYDDYEDLLDNILLNFSNDGYSSSGYPSSIGKYDFLMLYFHTAKIKKIINNYYRVNAATSKLLTDYSSDELIEFIKDYTDTAYEKYFSLGATRFVVYFDGDDDGKADDIKEWYDKRVDSTSEFYQKEKAEDEQMTFEEVAKQLIYDVYTIISASTGSHTDEISTLVDEINNSAKVNYRSNPIKSETLWAKYRHLGLKVMTEDITATNTSTDISFAIKQRLYDYSRGYSEDEDGNKTQYYEYFLENSDNKNVPTCYIEPIDYTDVDVDSDKIIESSDGYNLLLVTSGTYRASAKWLEKDDKTNILTNLALIYNKNVIKIDSIYSTDDEEGNLFTLNQIKLYLLDYVINGSSTLMPSELSDAISAFLSPVVTRYTGDETQRIILLTYIKNTTKQGDDKLIDVIKFDNEDYNGENGYFNRYMEIAEKVADDYSYIYGDQETIEKYGIEIDTTNTYDIYSYNGQSWWEHIKSIVDNILNKEEE